MNWDRTVNFIGQVFKLDGIQPPKDQYLGNYPCSDREKIIHKYHLNIVYF